MCLWIGHAGSPPERGLQSGGGLAAERAAKSAADVGVLAAGQPWVSRQKSS